MVSGVWSAVSGLQAFATRMNSTANNVANMQTEGFKKSRVLLSSTEPQGVRATVEQRDTPGPLVVELTANGQELVEQSNVDLGEEMTDMLFTKHGFTANLAVIRTEDEMAQHLLDIRA